MTWDYPMGGIQMLGKSDGEMLRGNAPHWATWGAKLTPGRSLEMMAHHAVDFWLSNEDLPLPENRVTLDGDGRVRLTVDKTNNIEGLKRLRKKLESMLSDLGLHDGTHHRNVYLYMGMAIAATAHQAGTAGSAPTPRRRCSTSTARPTTSTTSTSWTPASSSPSAR